MSAKEITLNIATPKGVFNGVFSNTDKIQLVISTVVEAMDLDGGDAFELIHGEEVLQPNERTLVSFGLSGTVKLELVATGSGV